MANFGKKFARERMKRHRCKVKPVFPRGLNAGSKNGLMPYSMPGLNMRISLALMPNLQRNLPTILFPL